MKKITLFCAAVAAALGMSAQETTPLTIDMWHQWDGFGADAQIVETTKELVSNLGKELPQGDFIMGNPACDGDCYANLSDYAGLEGTGTPGITVRMYFNREAVQGAGIDIKVDIDADGTFSYDFSKLPGKPSFVHLVFIKTAAGWQGGKWPEGLETAVVESINLILKSSSEEPEVPVDPLSINGDWFHQWDGFGADATVTNMYPTVDSKIGEEVGGGSTILGTGGVAGDIYADLTEYDGIEAEGTPGVSIRLLFNRPTQDSGITECVPTFDENGKFTFLFTEVKDGDSPASFIHLNAVKTTWGLPEGVTSCKITKFNAIPKATSGVEVIENADSNAVIYNIYGQRVDESYRGIVIKNGKKYINK